MLTYRWIVLMISLALVSARAQSIDAYLSNVDLKIKNKKYIEKTAKMNCFYQWQKIYTDSCGKVIKAIGGMPSGCYMFEKRMYLMNESVVFYEELYHPLKASECKALKPNHYSYTIDKNKVMGIDKITGDTLKITAQDTVLNNLQLDVKSIYLDLHSMCYESFTLNEEHIRSVNKKIIEKKIQPKIIELNEDSIQKILIYSDQNKMVLLKCLYQTDSLQMNYNLYYKDLELIDYNFDLYFYKKDSLEYSQHDRFQIEDKKIKNFKYLTLQNESFKPLNENELYDRIVKKAEELKIKAFNNNKN